MKEEYCTDIRWREKREDKKFPPNIIKRKHWSGKRIVENGF